MFEVNPLRRPVATSTTRAGKFPIINGLNHYAFRCRNAEETRKFYEDILGLPLAATIYHDRVPSTGEYHPYYHIFFEMADGSFLAFFDLLDDKACEPDPNTPSWVNHLALDVPSQEALVDAKNRLEAAGVEVLGVVDHKWFDSIYFFDPNGIRLELVWRTASLEDMRHKAEKARGLLADRDVRAAEFRQSKLSKTG